MQLGMRPEQDAVYVLLIQHAVRRGHTRDDSGRTHLPELCELFYHGGSVNWYPSLTEWVMLDDEVRDLPAAALVHLAIIGQSGCSLEEPHPCPLVGGPRKVIRRQVAVAGEHRRDR